MFNQSFYSPGCIQCGSFLVEESLFCHHCFNKFVVPRIENSFCGQPDRHIFLMEWPKADESLFDQLVYRLKASQSPEAINFYSDLLADRLMALQNLGQYEAMIPVPGSSRNRIHSERIALRLSQQTGIKTMPVLEKLPASNQQKILTSFERRKRNPFRYKANTPEEFTSLRSKAGSFIFVDDVLTTGQSIKHAESVLNTTKPNAVATIFYRPSGFKLIGLQDEEEQLN